MPLLAEHYGLEVRVVQSPVTAIADAPGRIEVVCDLVVRNSGRRPVTRVSAILYRLLMVSEATDARDPQRRLKVRQAVRALPEESRLQVNAITVELVEPLAPGATTTLRLAYAGTPVGYREVMPYVHDAVQPSIAVLRPEILWYPVLGAPTLQTY